MHVISVTCLGDLSAFENVLCKEIDTFFNVALAISYYSRLKIARGTLLKLSRLCEFSTRTCGIILTALHTCMEIHFLNGFYKFLCICYSYVIFERYIWINNISFLFFLCQVQCMSSLKYNYERKILLYNCGRKSILSCSYLNFYYKKISFFKLKLT